MEKELREELEEMGLSVLGRCNRPEPIIIDGRRIYPSSYGQYSYTCEACSGFEPKKGKTEKICGNCKYWEASGDYE